MRLFMLRLLREVAELRPPRLEREAVAWRAGAAERDAVARPRSLLRVVVRVVAEGRVAA
jgi:hypothetical protein